MFSQNKEAEEIIKYFDDYVGTFADIGANDGVTLSNSRDLALLNWQGVCIEPSPQAYIRLKNLYDGHKGIYTYNFAIGIHNGRMRFWDSGNHLNSNDIGLLSTSSPTELTRFPGTQYTEMDVKCYRWKTALNRFRIKSFDFISIDAEGFDLEILQQIDITNVKCLCIEWNLDQERKQQFSNYMQGFNIIYESPENLIYAR